MLCGMMAFIDEDIDLTFNWKDWIDAEYQRIIDSIAEGRR